MIPKTVISDYYQFKQRLNAQNYAKSESEKVHDKAKRDSKGKMSK